MRSQASGERDETTAVKVGAHARFGVVHNEASKTHHEGPRVAGIGAETAATRGPRVEEQGSGYTTAAGGRHRNPCRHSSSRFGRSRPLAPAPPLNMLGTAKKRNVSTMLICRRASVHARPLAAQHQGAPDRTGGSQAGDADFGRHLARDAGRGRHPTTAEAPPCDGLECFVDLDPILALRLVLALITELGLLQLLSGEHSRGGRDARAVQRP